MLSLRLFEKREGRRMTLSLSLSLSLSGNASKTENSRGDETKLRPPTGLLKP
jgi:hypothetical protein